MTAAVVLLSLGTAAQALAAPGVPLVHHGDTAPTDDVNALQLVVRIALLLGTAVVAGIGLFRGSVTELTSRLRFLAWGAAGLASAALAVSVLWLNVNLPVGIAQLALTLAMPLLLRWPTAALSGGLLLALILTAETAVGHGGIQFLIDTVGTLAAVTWLGLASLAVAVPEESRKPSSYRPGPLALTIGAALVAVGIGQFVFADLGVDRRIYSSSFGIILLVVVLAPIVVAVLAALALRGRSETEGPWRAYRVGAAGVALAFLAWGVLPAIPRPPELPVPGVPLLATVDLADRQNSLLITPQRPGRNLVHLPENLDGAKVGVNGSALRATATQPGTQGRWAVVDLPKGRAELTVAYRDEQSTVDVDTGTQRGGPASATGPDAAECSSAALGSLLAQSRTTLDECPADRLSESDDRALRSAVRFFADRKIPAVTLVSDASPRSRQAREVVAAAAKQERIPLTERQGRDNALLVVSGWRGAAEKLNEVKQVQATQTAYTRGVFLAPWLLNSALVRTTASSLLPLTVDPRERDALDYAIAVRNTFPGETATMAGFHAWMAGRNQSAENGPVQLYAAAQVDVWQLNTQAPAEASPVAAHHSAGYGQWLPGGTIIPATGELR